VLLAVDIGNTNVTLGLFRGEKLTGSWRISSDSRRTADEYAHQVAGVLGKNLRRVRTMAVASVVPPLEAAFRQSSRDLFGDDAVVIDHDSPLGFRIGYSPPSDVGADRLVNAAAALERYGAPVIVVDFGTAVTLDVVDRHRVYLGGAIAPGLELAGESLFRRTAKLPQIAPSIPGAVIGRSTRESINSGLVLGMAAMVDGLLERFFAELKARVRVVATGGAAGVVVPHCRLARTVDPDLTLVGIRIVASRQAGCPPRARRR